MALVCAGRLQGLFLEGFFGSKTINININSCKYLGKSDLASLDAGRQILGNTSLDTGLWRSWRARVASWEPLAVISMKASININKNMI